MSEHDNAMFFSVRAFGHFCLHLWAMLLTIGVLWERPLWFNLIAIVVLCVARVLLVVDSDRRRAAYLRERESQ